MIFDTIGSKEELISQLVKLMQNDQLYWIQAKWRM